MTNPPSPTNNNHRPTPARTEGAPANCTLGEMVQAMADSYGRYTGGPEL